MRLRGCVCPDAVSNPRSFPLKSHRQALCDCDKIREWRKQIPQSFGKPGARKREKSPIVLERYKNSEGWVAESFGRLGWGVTDGIGE